MTRLAYTEAELMAEHDYARPQQIAGHRIHGGFDADGNYVPPRTLHRQPALDAWTKALRARGGELLPADSSLLAGIRYPSEAQQKLLIQEGLGQTFWNTLTITGKIEARGRVLADMTFPDLQDVVVEDLSECAVGHLNRGLLKAHGLDEGGEPAKGIGGHDVMWFALRDLAFGPNAYPDAEPAANIARPEQAASIVPGLSVPHERTLYFLCNLLMIEFRAERGFSLTERMLRDPELFTTRRAQAEEAADVVERIRIDEAVHVHSLRLYLGELRACTFRLQDGSTLPGREVVDAIWGSIEHWATVEQPKLAAEQQRQLLAERIARHPQAARIQAAFDSLEEAA